MKAHSIRLLTNHFDETFAFYAETLGLDISWGKPGEVYASFKIAGQVAIALFDETLMNQALGNVTTKNTRNNDTAVIVLDVDDVDGFCDRLKSRGVTFVTEPHDMPGWGNRCAHIRDPEGNLIELSAALAMDQWDQDLKEAAEAYNQ